MIWLAPVGSCLALLFAGYLIRYILKQDEGTEKMRQIAAWVREGSVAYIKRQYTIVGLFFLVIFLLLFFLVHKGYLTIFVPFAFLSGGNKEKNTTYPHHHEKFNIDEDALPIGVSLYAQFALDFLNK